MSATFTPHEVRLQLSNKRILSTFLDQLVLQYRPEVTKKRLQYIFCSDEYLLSMNLQYLQHDTLTDIITFDLSDKPDELKGEIYISTERVKENAAHFGVTFTQELHRVIFHGALHLCGFKDKTPNEEQQMRKLENNCLEQYFSEKEKEGSACTPGKGGDNIA